MKQSLNILYEDTHIIVCEKPHGVATQSRNIGAADMVSILKNHIRQNTGNTNPYLAVIHRLDQPVRGILVFAKTPFAAKELNKQLTSKEFGKYYRALVSTAPPKPSDTLENYLVKDTKTNLSRVCEPDTPDAKLARLHYEIITDENITDENISNETITKDNRLFLSEQPDETELNVILDTGRHHQIRVQLSHMGCPIVGDAKYNSSRSSSRRNICLCAYRLEFKHPKTQKALHFSLL